MYARVLKVMDSKTSFFIICHHFIAPVSDDVFAILGEDRTLYTPIDSDIGKNYAVWIVKKIAWNVSKVKVRRIGTSAVYTIPKSFAKHFNLKKGDLMLAVGNDNTLELIPLSVVITKIGKFRGTSLP